CTTSLLDFLSSTFGKPVRGNTERLGHFTISKYYYVVLRLFDQTAIVQNFRSDLFVGVEVLIERAETDLEPLLLEDVGKAALGKTPVQRHLTTFKADLARIT